MGETEDRGKLLEAKAALAGLRILDMGGLRVAYCARLLADLGADVILVEPPDGDPLRKIPPFVGDEPGPDRSLAALAFHTNKRSVVVDVTTTHGRALFRQLAASSDVILEGFQPEYLDGLGLTYDSLAVENPRLVLCRVTPFGQTGPHAAYKGLDLQAEAMGGLMMIQGDPSLPPCVSPGFLGYSLPGVHAAIGVLHALHARERTGRGQTVDVSMQEAIANIYNIVSQYGFTASIAERPGDTGGGGVSAYSCRDGVALLTAFQAKQFMAIADWVGHPALKDPVFENSAIRKENAEFIDGLIQEFMSNLTVEEAIIEAQRRRIPSAAVSTPGEFTRNPHVQARDYFVTAAHPVLGTYELPGAPGLLSETAWRIYRPAPRLGEHTSEVLDSVNAPSRIRRRRRAPTRVSPLEGVRITDLTRVWVGPYATRQLADFGAEVIKIESSLFDVNTRTPAIYPSHPEMNRNKLSITVDLHTTEGQDLVKRLISVSDAVTENYAPGALRRWGLDYESVRKVKPDVVYLSVSGWGQTGPYSQYLSFGRQATAPTGVVHMWGHPGSPPSLHCTIDYSDFFVGAIAGFLLEAALYRRRQTGEGQLIEVSMVEAQGNAFAVPLLDYWLNGREGSPAGNARPYAAPHGVYPCKQPGSWCAIACVTDEEWHGLGRALTPMRGEPPSWTQDPRFSTLDGRLEAREEIDRLLARWTGTMTPRQVMVLLQREGVPASAVQNNEEVFFDPHLGARGYIVPMTHAEPQWKGIHHAWVPAMLSETPASLSRGAPALGEHTNRVLRKVLNLTEAEILRLKETKALA